MSTDPKSGLSPGPIPELSRCSPTHDVAKGGTKEITMSTNTMSLVKDEQGATTAEYAVCTGAGVGFAGLLYKFITSEAGQQFLSLVWKGITALLPF